MIGQNELYMLLIKLLFHRIVYLNSRKINIKHYGFESLDTEENEMNNDRERRVTSINNALVDDITLSLFLVAFVHWSV